MKCKYHLMATNLLVAGSLWAGNPILPGKGVCDPQMRVFGDRVWLYATHDRSASNTGFTTDDWWVWSSSDLVTWTHESTLRPQDTFFKRASNLCWATDAATRNGKYYFYFSMGTTDIGVVAGETPKGPWKDPLGKALIDSRATPTLERDPGILMDDDGQAYIVFGCWNFYIARLNEDMVSLAETPRKITITSPEGPYGKGKTDDKPFLHKYGGKYYLSWGCYYGTADQLYGPYECKGSIVLKERLAPEFREMQPDFKKVVRGVTYDRHGSFFEFNNQWYFVCNDMSQPGSHPTFRNSVLAYLHYRDNGDIEPVYIDGVGVGQYDAARGPIQAENYFKLVGARKRQCPNGGFELRDIKDGTWALYPKVGNLPADSLLSLHLSRAREGGQEPASIEVRSGGPEGELLGRAPVPCTDNWDTYQTVECRLKNQPGTADVCLVFKGRGAELLRLDWLGFR